jgi:hypothetical protein
MKTTNITEQKEFIKILVVVDADGQIIGAAGLGGKNSSEQKLASTALRPLPGQSIQEVQVPIALLKLRSAPQQLQHWFAQHLVRPGGCTLIRRDNY